MGTRFERFESKNEIHHDGLSRLEIKAAELEHKFSEWRDWLEHELTASGAGHNDGTRDQADDEDLADDETSLIDTPVPDMPAIAVKIQDDGAAVARRQVPGEQ